MTVVAATLRVDGLVVVEQLPVSVAAVLLALVEVVKQS